MANCILGLLQTSWAEILPFSVHWGTTTQSGQSSMTLAGSMVSQFHFLVHSWRTWLGNTALELCTSFISSQHPVGVQCCYKSMKQHMIDFFVYSFHSTVQWFIRCSFALKQTKYFFFYMGGGHSILWTVGLAARSVTYFTTPPFVAVSASKIKWADQTIRTSQLGSTWAHAKHCMRVHRKNI